MGRGGAGALSESVLDNFEVEHAAAAGAEARKATGVGFTQQPAGGKPQGSRQLG